MKWEIIYHKDVDEDLKSVGPAAARRIIKTIDKKLACEPVPLPFLPLSS